MSTGEAVREGGWQAGWKTHEQKLAQESEKNGRKFKEARKIAGLDAASHQWSESTDQQHVQSIKWLSNPNYWNTNFLNYDSKCRGNKRQDKFYCLNLKEISIAKNKQTNKHGQSQEKNDNLGENICNTCYRIRLSLQERSNDYDRFWMRFLGWWLYFISWSEGQWMQVHYMRQDWAVNSCFVHFSQHTLEVTNKMWLKSEIVG